MGQFDRQIATALKLIKKNGQLVQWRIETNDILDPGKPWLVTEPAAAILHDVYICFLPDDRENKQFAAYLKGTEVVSGTTIGLMGNVEFEPDIKDVVIRDGEQYNIANINLFSPNGQKILYTVEFKK